jgi:hypothetical protein
MFLFQTSIARWGCSVSLDGLLFKPKTDSKIRESLVVCTCPFLNILAAVSLSKISVVPKKTAWGRNLRKINQMLLFAGNDCTKKAQTWRQDLEAGQNIYKRLKGVWKRTSITLEREGEYVLKQMHVIYELFFLCCFWFEKRTIKTNRAARTCYTCLKEKNMKISMIYLICWLSLVSFFLENWVQQVFYALSFEHRMYICMWGCSVNAEELFSKQLFTEQWLVPPILRACVHMHSRT